MNVFKVTSEEETRGGRSGDKMVRWGKGAAWCVTFWFIVSALWFTMEAHSIFEPSKFARRGGDTCNPSIQGTETGGLLLL